MKEEYLREIEADQAFGRMVLDWYSKQPQELQALMTMESAYDRHLRERKEAEQAKYEERVRRILDSNPTSDQLTFVVAHAIAMGAD